MGLRAGLSIGIAMGINSGASGSCGLPAPVSFSDTILWLDADHTTHSGDGTEITAASDRSASGGNLFQKATAGGPVMRSTGWNGQKAIEIGPNKGIYCPIGSAPAAAFLAGKDSATTEYTVITCFQPRQNLAILPWNFTRVAASTHGVQCQYASHAYLPQVFGGTATGAKTAKNCPTYLDHAVPCVMTFRRSGGGTPVVVWRQDGVNQADVAWDWTGNYNCDAFGVGVRPTAVNAFGNLAWVTDVIVFSRALTDAEVAQWEAYLGQRRSFVHKLNPTTATGDWLVVWFRGQSNIVGAGNLSDTTYSYTDDGNTYAMSLDGFVRPMTVKACDGANAAAVSLTFLTPTYATFAAAIAKRLQALGETRKLLFVMDGMGSTPASTWANGIASSPPTINTLCGYARHRVRDALKAPGASLFGVVDQGESNGSNDTDAAAWRTDWTSIVDSDNTYFAAAWDKTVHYVFGRLCLVTFPGVVPSAAAVRTAQDTFAGERADAVFVQNPNATDTPGHRIGAEQEAAGTLYADAWWSAA